VTFIHYPDSRDKMRHTMTELLVVWLNAMQDFEALQPNLLARTIETVEGGGIIVLLLSSLTSLSKLYTMTMVSTMSIFCSKS
jgi:tRNA(Met) C34 N-acetyltransferase TmcA